MRDIGDAATAQVAIHVLANRPLTVAHGKALVAKELMAFTGTNNYYHDHAGPGDLLLPGDLLPGHRQGGGGVGRPPHALRRYLAFDGHALTMNSRDVNHQPHYLKASLTLLVAVALATDRILVNS